MHASPQKRPFEIEMPLPIKTYDIDFAGIVSNIVYVRWLEDLRLEMLAHYFPLNEQLKNGIVPVIVQTKIDYKQPLKISDAPNGKMWIKTLGGLRWTVNAEISVNGKVSALGEQVGIFFDTQNNKPIRIPKVLLQKYDELSVEGHDDLIRTL
ncbi:MAG: acyl-CoA thioesterase [Oscillatoriophycideae cyanobacterium NC_groundwater_1537_Pr4_S-0.65um_50_18]|nr:acyl-CoA thioesterase [Oscillatoriophycideae cyanobacterium NC_groundwater_1537_Pr4_S-0.65um_50_18]